MTFVIVVVDIVLVVVLVVLAVVNVVVVAVTFPIEYSILRFSEYSLKIRVVYRYRIIPIGPLTCYMEYLVLGGVRGGEIEIRLILVSHDCASQYKYYQQYLPDLVLDMVRIVSIAFA